MPWLLSGSGGFPERIRCSSRSGTISGLRAEFLAMTEELYRLEARGDYRSLSLEQLEAWNCRLYGEILKERVRDQLCQSGVRFRNSWGAEYGPLLAFLYTELRDDIVFCPRVPSHGHDYPAGTVCGNL